MEVPKLADDLGLKTPMKRGEEMMRASASNFSATGAPEGVHLFRFREGLRLQKWNQPTKKFDIHFSQVRSIDFEGESENREQRSVVGRAVIGKYVAGDTGAMVGALSGLQDKVTSSRSFGVTYWDPFRQEWKQHTLSSDDENFGHFMECVAEELHAYRQGTDPESIPDPSGRSELDRSLERGFDKLVGVAIGIVVIVGIAWFLIPLLVGAVKTVVMAALWFAFSPGLSVAAATLQGFKIPAGPVTAMVLGVALCIAVIAALWYRLRGPKAMGVGYAVACVLGSAVLMYNANLRDVFANGVQLRTADDVAARYEQERQQRDAAVASAAKAEATAPAGSSLAQSPAPAETVAVPSGVTTASGIAPTASASVVAHVGNATTSSRPESLSSSSYAPKADTTPIEAATPSSIPAMPDAATEPSFNCEKASSFAEKSICASPALARLDRALNDGYIVARQGPDGDRIQQDQKLWLAQRSRCKDDRCLSDLYRIRIAQLASHKR